MVENSMNGAFARSPQLARFAPGVASPVVYGITALRYDGGQMAEVLMGMFDPAMEHWDQRPAPTRLVEVVDRLVEGDTVIALFPTESGQLQAGPEIKVDVLAEGTEALAMAEDRPGRRLADLPRF